MTTYNTYAEAKIANPEKVIHELNGLFGTKQELIDCGVTGFIYETNPADHCMSLEAFFEAGHKFVEGDKWLSRDNSVITIGVHGTVQCANEPKIYDNARFVLSAKALEEVKISSLQSLKKKALSNPKVKEEYDTLESEFEQVEWNGEGLPPVGCNCLFKKKSEEDKYFSPCYIIGYRETTHRKGDMWLVFSDKYDSLYQHNVTNGSFDFKKPETPEQKKEREREMAIYDMCSSLDNHSEETRFWAERFYDAGYRKPE
jgi:hypothetical protein